MLKQAKMRNLLKVLETINALCSKRLLCPIIFSCALSVTSFAQDSGWGSLSEYELPKAIVKGLSNQFSDVEAIDDLTLSCTNTTDFSAYRSHHRYYLVDASVDEVWKQYLDSDLKSGWSGKTINYGFAYSRASNEVFAGDHDVVLKPNPGFGLFLELDILKLLKIPVAFELSRIDKESKVLQFTYLKRNKSNGRQTITFKEYGQHQTLILHQTYFRSDKKFRDKYLYAPIHTNLIDQFHAMVLKDIASIETVSLRKMKKSFPEYWIN